MPAYKIHPLTDPRWAEFVERHPRASVFHTPGWLEALHRSYGYEPVVVATSERGQELRSGVVFCRVDSFLTGRRLVSVPFADHCEPLVDGPTDFAAILSSLQQDFHDRKYKYIEIRPRSFGWAPRTVFAASAAFWFHTLDLRPETEQLLRSFNKNSV